MNPVAETFSDVERVRLAPHFTNLDRPVFALVNLPETVKGALFARYSRYGGTLRRLFLDEFADSLGPVATAGGQGTPTEGARGGGAGGAAAGGGRGVGVLYRRCCFRPAPPPPPPPPSWAARTSRSSGA